MNIFKKISFSTKALSKENIELNARVEKIEDILCKCNFDYKENYETLFEINTKLYHENKELKHKLSVLANEVSFIEKFSQSVENLKN